jgi:hypothetical protein
VGGGREGSAEFKMEAHLRLCARGGHRRLDLLQQRAGAVKVLAQPVGSGDLGLQDQGVVTSRGVQGSPEPLLTDVGPCKVPERCEVDGHGRVGGEAKRKGNQNGRTQPSTLDGARRNQPARAEETEHGFKPHRAA